MKIISHLAIKDLGLSMGVNPARPTAAGLGEYVTLKRLKASNKTLFVGCGMNVASISKRLKGQSVMSGRDLRRKVHAPQKVLEARVGA